MAEIFIGDTTTVTDLEARVDALEAAIALKLDAASVSVFGASLVDDASSTEARSTLGLVIGTNVQAASNKLAVIHEATWAADKLGYFTGASTFATTSLTAFARTILDDADAAAVRTTIGAVGTASPAFTGTPTAPTATAGTNTTQIATTAFVTTALAGKQASHANLAAFAGLSLVSDRLPYASGTGTLALATFTAFARTLLDDADAATARATLGAAALASPAFTGTPTAPTAASGTNTTQLATTAFVAAAVAAGGGGATDLPFVLLSAQTGAAADAQQIANKSAALHPSGGRFSISAGSAVVTASNVTPFVAGDVGKTIVIAGAGASGADLTTTIAGFTSSTQVTLAATASTAISTGSEKGLTWGTPADTELQAAFNAINTVAVGGGEVVVDGWFMLTSATTVNMASISSSITLRGFGSGSRLYICCGTSTEAITFQSAQHQVLIEGVTFVGTTGRVTDAARVLVFDSCWDAVVRHCGFYGLASKTTNGNPSIIQSNQGWYRGEYNFFGGCGVLQTSPATDSVGIVDHVDFKGVYHHAEKYIDYGQLGPPLHEKVASHVVNAWIIVRDHLTPDPATAMNHDNLVEFRRLNMDEGTTYGIAVVPTTGRVQRVIVEGIEENVGGADTARGIYCVNVDDVEIRKSWLGYASNPNAYVAGFLSCGRVLIDSCVVSGALANVISDSVDDLTIKDTPGIAGFTSLTDPGSKYATNYHPVDSRYAPYALIKGAAVTDADFIAAPARGTKALDVSTGREYVKKLNSGGWIFFTYSGGDFYGPEKVTNGTGAATSGWTTGFGTHSLVGGRHRIASPGGTEGYIYQTISDLEVGQTYELKIDLFAGTAPALAKVGVTLGDTDYANWTATPGSPVVFTATSAQVTIVLYANSTTAGQYAEYDNITLKAV